MGEADEDATKRIIYVVIRIAMLLLICGAAWFIFHNAR